MVVSIFLLGLEFTNKQHTNAKTKDILIHNLALAKGAY
jgi:hypothetical protein